MNEVTERTKADGFCFRFGCNEPVPPTNLNLFYCSEACREWAFQQSRGKPSSLTFETVARHNQGLIE